MSTNPDLLLFPDFFCFFRFHGSILSILVYQVINKTIRKVATKMLIYIVEHSEARPNVKGFLQGWISNPLNEKQQVTSRCHRPGNERHRVQCVYRKPYIACKKTAEIIIRKTAIICIPICFDDHIKGINMDDWEKKL